MIVRSIQTEGLGCFADSFSAGPFAPGINLVYAPNGTGKSTLFRAVSLAFLEPHRGKSVEVQALRPWRRHLAPQVAVEFEHCGRIYRIRKRFLDGPSAHVETSEGNRWTSFAQGDKADDFLRDLLKCESERPRSEKPEHWGLAQVLWTTQGDLSVPPLASTVIESIRGSVGAQLAARDAAIEARVQEEYLKYFSPTAGRLKSGRNGAPLRNLEAERDRLDGELLSAQAMLRDFERESEQIEHFREAEVSANARREALAVELERLRLAVDDYKNLRSQQRERTALRDGAREKHRAVVERIEAIEQARKQITTSEEGLSGLKSAIPLLTATLEQKQKVAGAADVARENAAAREEQARGSLTKAQLADGYVRAVAEWERVGQRLSEIGTAKAELQAATELRARLNAPSDTQVRELRKAQAAETDCRRRLEMARITVGFVPEKRVEVEVSAGEQPGTVVCGPGERIVLPGAPTLSFVIKGVGRFEATGPVADYEAVRRTLDQQTAWLSTFAEQFGTTDPDTLENRRREAIELDGRIRDARKSISKLLEGRTEEGWRELHGTLSEQIRTTEAAYPEWHTQMPDAAAMLSIANSALTESAAARNGAEESARQAHRALVEARLQLNSATDQQSAVQEQLARAQNTLAVGLADGLSDEERRQTLDEMALRYDACRLELERIEGELKRFAEDPELALKRISVELKKVENSAGCAKEDRLRAETRIEAIVERRPYASVNDASERLALVREQIAREQRRMDALELLQKTFETARAELMVEVAAPVERIATDYLEEICGKPIGEIRLTKGLLAETVIPTGFTGDEELQVELNRLSGGEREQIFLCTWLALGSEVARRERQMLVLDDVLTFTDDERMRRICWLLEKASERLQLIILTCHPERFANLPAANRIDLVAAIGWERVAASV